MNTEQEIRIPVCSKLCPVCQRHGHIIRMSQIDIHIIVFCQFLVHGQRGHHGHFFLLCRAFQRSLVITAVSGINDNDDPFSGLLRSGSRLCRQGISIKTGCCKTDRTDHCPD